MSSHFISLVSSSNGRWLWRHYGNSAFLIKRQIQMAFSVRYVELQALSDKGWANFRKIVWRALLLNIYVLAALVEERRNRWVSRNKRTRSDELNITRWNLRLTWCDFVILQLNCLSKIKIARPRFNILVIRSSIARDNSVLPSANNLLAMLLMSTNWITNESGLDWGSGRRLLRLWVNQTISSP